MKIKLAFTLIFFFILPSLVAAQQPEPIKYSDKYEKLFYPEGMPVRYGKYKSKGKPVYSFLADYKIPNSNQVIVFYSENNEFERDEFNEEVGHYVEDYDIGRKIFLGVLARDGKKLSVKNKSDITELLLGSDPTSLEEGAKEIDGSIEAINIFSEKKTLVLNFYVLFSGTGRNQYNSKFFFELMDDKPPKNILRIDNVSSFGRTGKDNFSMGRTAIYLVKNGYRGLPEIYTQDEDVEQDPHVDAYREMVQDKYSAYRYNEDEHEFIATGGIEHLPAGAVELFPEKKSKRAQAIARVRQAAPKVKAPAKRGLPSFFPARKSSAVGTEKYKDIIYPEGLPEKAESWSSQKYDFEFRFLSEYPILGTDKIFVTYALYDPGKDGRDKTHWARVAVLEKKEGKIILKKKMESISRNHNGRYPCDELRAHFTGYDAFEGTKGIILCLYCRVGENENSDAYFYLTNKKEPLEHVFTVPYFSHAGPWYSHYPGRIDIFAFFDENARVGFATRKFAGDMKQRDYSVYRFFEKGEPCDCFVFDSQLDPESKELDTRHKRGYLLLRYNRLPKNAIKVLLPRSFEEADR